MSKDRDIIILNALLLAEQEHIAATESELLRIVRHYVGKRLNPKPTDEEFGAVLSAPVRQLLALSRERSEI